MKKVARIHLVWGAVALVAFFSGYFVLPSSSEKGPAFIPRLGGQSGDGEGEVERLSLIHI